MHERKLAAGWEARVRVRDPAGEMRDVTRRRSSRAAARTAVLVAAAEIKPRVAPTGPGELSPGMTVGALLDAWFAEWRDQNPAGQSVATYRGNLAALPASLAALRVGEATTPVLDREVKARAATSPGAARMMRSLLRQAFAMAVRHGVVDRNPADATAPVARPKKNVKTLEVTEIGALLAHLQTLPADGDQLMLQAGHALAVMLGTGLRIGEVLALRRVDDLALDAEVPTLTVSGTLVKGADTPLVRQPWPKADRSFRSVPLPPGAVAALKATLELPLPPSAMVFPGPDGGLARPATIRARIEKLYAAAGVTPGHTPHSLRRTAGTTIAKARGVATAADVLGNDVITANRHYVAVVQHVVEDVRDLLDFQPTRHDLGHPQA